MPTRWVDPVDDMTPAVVERDGADPLAVAGPPIQRSFAGVNVDRSSCSSFSSRPENPAPACLAYPAMHRRFGHVVLLREFGRRLASRRHEALVQRRHGDVELVRVPAPFGDRKLQLPTSRWPRLVPYIAHSCDGLRERQPNPECLGLRGAEPSRLAASFQAASRRSIGTDRDSSTRTPPGRSTWTPTIVTRPSTTSTRTLIPGCLSLSSSTHVPSSLTPLTVRRTDACRQGPPRCTANHAGLTGADSDGINKLV